MSAVVVTGTGTGIGKTVTVAALAAATRARGLSPGVVKPVQTGLLPGEPGDADVATRLSGTAARAVELVRLPDPLALATAARLRGVEIPPVATLAASVAALAERHDVLLVEGAGGLLVRLDSAGGTVADLATGLREQGVGVAVVVVTTAELGTLNATELTVEALRSRGIPPLGLVIGSWPDDPQLVQRCNLDDLPALTGVPLLGAIPAGAGALAPADFSAAAPGWLDASAPWLGSSLG